VGTSLRFREIMRIAVGSDGLVSYNISNPANPTYTGWGNASHPSSVYAQGRYAYVTDTPTTKLDVFDVSKTPFYHDNGRIIEYEFIRSLVSLCPRPATPMLAIAGTILVSL